MKYRQRQIKKDAFEMARQEKKATADYQESSKNQKD